jgi:hypothetical protein
LAAPAPPGVRLEDRRDPQKGYLGTSFRIAKHLDAGTHEWFFIDASQGDSISELLLHPDYCAF